MFQCESEPGKAHLWEFTFMLKDTGNKVVKQSSHILSGEDGPQCSEVMEAECECTHLKVERLWEADNPGCLGRASLG